MNPRYTVTTGKSPAQALEDLEASVKRHGYGVLHAYDLKQTLAGKGFDLPAACHILEVCNPQQAFSVLSEDMSMNVALPCRISVYQEGGATIIGMVRPTAILAALSQSDKLAAIARKVEADTIAIIEAAK